MNEIGLCTSELVEFALKQIVIMDEVDIDSVISK